MLDLNLWDRVPGWFNKAEAQVLYDIAFEVPEPATIVEIGSYEGRSTIVLLQACADTSPGKRKIVQCIDNFSGTGEEFGNSTAPGRQHGIAKLKKNIADFKVTPWLGTIHPITSKSWFDLRTEFKYAMFFVDGCHPSVAYDVIEAWNRLRPGGILVCHDYDINDQNSEVVKEIDRLNLPGAHCGVSGTSLWKVVKPL